MNLILIATCYLLGAFPTGYLLAKRAGVDLSQVGSGNVGATNVSRALGKRAGIITLLVDTAKGALAVGLGYYYGSNSFDPGMAGVAAVCGHCLSIPGVLKGGKGVATSLGVVTALHPLLGVASLVLFGASFYASRIVSLSSIIAELGTPTLSALLAYPTSSTIPLAIVGLIVVIRHYQNIQRLLAGTEPRKGREKQQ